MSDLLIKPAQGSRVHNITPASAGWKYVGFELHDLVQDQEIVLQQAGREVCLVVLTGRAAISVGNAQ